MSLRRGAAEGACPVRSRVRPVGRGPDSGSCKTPNDPLGGRRAVGRSTRRAELHGALFPGLVLGAVTHNASGPAPLFRQVVMALVDAFFLLLRAGSGRVPRRASALLGRAPQSWTASSIRARGEWRVLGGHGLIVAGTTHRSRGWMPAPFMADAPRRTLWLAMGEAVGKGCTERRGRG